MSVSVPLAAEKGSAEVADGMIMQDNVLITDQLRQRSPRQPNLAAEVEVFRSLGQQLTQPTQIILKHFTEIAKELCQAGTAEISLIETTPSGDEIFRWVAVTGAYEQYEGRTESRHCSPCAVCLERGGVQLFSHPERYFSNLQEVTPAPVEVLTVPLISEGRSLGVIWIVSHDEQRKFDPEDARVVASLADFLAVALASAQARQTAEESQRLFQHMVEASPDVVFIYDLEAQRNIYLSDRAEQIFNCTAADMADLGDRAIAELVHREDIPQVRAAIEAMRHLSDAETYEFEYRSPYCETYRWLHARARVFARGEDGRVQQIIGLLQDVTARRQTEAALRVSEERTRLATEAAQMYTWEVDLTTQTVKFSPNVTQVLGFARPKEIAANLDLIHPDDRDHVVEEYHQMLSGAERLHSEHRLVNPDTGESVWIQAQGLRIEAHRCLGITQNISDRKCAEEALRDQKTRLRLIIESAKDYAIFTLDTDGHITSWNSGAQRLLGYEEAEIVGQHGSIIYTPEDVAAGDSETELQTALTQGRKENERWHICKDKSRFWGSGLIAPLRDEDNSIRGFLKILQDKTEQRQAEEALRQSEARLQLALQVGRMGSWDWDMQNGTVTWSEGHFTLLGFKPNEIQPNYKSWRESVYSADLEATEAVLQQAMTNRTEFHHEYRTVWRDGSLHWTEARGQFSYDEDGQPCRMIGVIVDISNRKQAEQERDQLLADEQAAREHAEAANRIKDEFLAVLSHELRSPLNPILGWIGLLRNGRLNAAKTAQALETIERNAKLQTQLIEDLLDVSRILRGKLTLNSTSINLAVTIRAALETVRLAAEAKSILIQTNLDPAPHQVLGDSTRLQQVVWNLLSNAVKFTPEGGRISIELTFVEENSVHYAQIQVGDTGQGISPDFLPHVFDYFRQADSTTTRKFGGLGLGLAIVRQLVELHGGTVHADSLGEGQGATFTVRLPLLGQQNEAITKRIIRSSLPTANASPLAGLQILVVDDEVDSREFVVFVLQQAGAIVTPVSSAFEALEIFTRIQPDLLISDIGMPKMDGYMLLRQLRLKPEGAQILAIALTSYAGEVNEQQAIAAGFQQHLSKPVEPAKLIEAIESLIQHC